MVILMKIWESFLITCPGRDLGFSYRVVDVHRCKRLQESVEATYMDEAFKYAALDSDDLLYLKEQMEAEEDAERLLRRTEKPASVADSSPASVPLPLRVEPKPKSGIRQQVFLKKVVEVKPKRQKVTSASDGNEVHLISRSEAIEDEKEYPPTRPNKAEDEAKVNNPVKSLLAAYESSDSEED
ncbi:unnamed protein product [Ilex paraguariensis]|uniref:Uncharacterized protein n=1 Tax=Ilex paraguariensis TaxID=185542 RepID=A0ABC8T4K7_9AQUA